MPQHFDVATDPWLPAATHLRHAVPHEHHHLLHLLEHLPRIRRHTLQHLHVRMSAARFVLTFSVPQGNVVAHSEQIQRPDRRRHWFLINEYSRVGPWMLVAELGRRQRQLVDLLYGFALDPVAKHLLHMLVQKVQGILVHDLGLIDALGTQCVERSQLSEGWFRGLTHT